MHLSPGIQSQTTWLAQLQLGKGHMDISVKRLLVPSTLPPTSGAQRVALHSMFRLICEANQLIVNDVVSALNAPLYGPADDQRRKLVKSIHLIDAGSVNSGRLVTFLASVTGFEKLKALTLADFVGLKGVAPLTTRPYRQWCPHCYTEDIANGLPPYDRLLWSIDLVRYCPIHDAALRSKCDRCGGSRAPQLFGRDISGFCPRCFEWLGENVGRSASAPDDQTKHLLWVARSFADLLNSPPSPEIDLLPGIQFSIRKLADFHHKGATTYVARQIGRNKSVVSTWLAGKSSPAWDAVCDLSYVYQQPLSALLAGELTGITSSDPLVLPTAARPRQGLRRKRPVVRDPAAIVRLLDDVAIGLHPGITAVRQVADRLNMNVRDLYRLAPLAAKTASAAVARRNAVARSQLAAFRLSKRDQTMHDVAVNLASRKSKVTRRVVQEEMAKSGIAIRWAESKEILSKMRRLVAAADGGLVTPNEDSGTS